jgi:cobalamin biosynthesis protein CobT
MLPATTETSDATNEALSWPSATDIPEEVFEETSEPETTEPEAADEPAEEAAEEAPAEEATEEPETPAETFDRDYVEKLRNEAADYRVRAKEFHEAFEGYDEAATAKFLDLARGLNDETRHREVGVEFFNIGKRILESLGEDVGDLAAPDPNRPLTKAELDAEFAAREEERNMAQLVEAIDHEIKELGYTQGSPDHYALMRLANDRDDGSIEEAHKSLQAWKKGIIDEWAKSFQEKQSKHLKTAPAVGVAPSDPGEEIPLDWEGARARMNQRFEDQG